MRGSRRRSPTSPASWRSSRPSASSAAKPWVSASPAQFRSAQRPHRTCTNAGWVGEKDGKGEPLVKVVKFKDVEGDKILAAIAKEEAKSAKKSAKEAAAIEAAEAKAKAKEEKAEAAAAAAKAKAEAAQAAADARAAAVSARRSTLQIVCRHSETRVVVRRKARPRQAGPRRRPRRRSRISSTSSTRWSWRRR